MNSETHPNWYFDVPVMKTLILGSFPPHHTKWDYNFYYPNKQNLFWKILAQIAHTELIHYKGYEAIEERKNIMLQLNVGVQNMGKKIFRAGLSARDTDISIIEFQDIVSIFQSHKELQKIILAGYSAKSSTYHAFVKYMKQHGIIFSEPLKVKANVEFDILINDRKITCVIINSTSTATRISLSVLLDQFQNALK